jgi:3'(2'), 5'-bisphosphate nucleotidase
MLTSNIVLIDKGVNLRPIKNLGEFLHHLLVSIHAAIEAGNAILQVYRSADFKVELKADRSPLTLADRNAHEIIMQNLSKFDIPVLSEEGKNIPYEKRKSWDVFWLVDPLDGTKEFIKKNGEFTVNIAMISQNKPVAGVVLVPDKNILYFASREIGSFRVDVSQLAELVIGKFGNIDWPLDLSETEAADILSALIGRSANLPINESTNQPYTIAGSRSHPTPELEAFVEEKRRQYGEVDFISAGSSLKLCLVAEGRADIYPRTGPTMEWDTAAGQAVVESAGGKVLQYETDQPLTYNKADLLNPWFVALKGDQLNRKIEN